MGISFLTDRGIEVPAITTDQMRQVDRIAIEETGPNLFQMMENAGRNLALSAIDWLGKGWQSANIIVLAGTGGNGGGGICAARHLANRDARIRVCLTNSENLGAVPAFQRSIYQSTNGKEISFEQLIANQVDLILDTFTT